MKSRHPSVCFDLFRSTSLSLLHSLLPEEEEGETPLLPLVMEPPPPPREFEDDLAIEPSVGCETACPAGPSWTSWGRGGEEDLPHAGLAA